MVLFVDVGEIENAFRKVAMQRYGYSKGAIRNAVSEAIYYWLRANSSSKLKKLDDPVGAIRDCLKGKTSQTSVELQHAAIELFAGRTQKRGG